MRYVKILLIIFCTQNIFAQSTFLKPHNFTYSGWRAGFRPGVYNSLDSGFKHLVYIDGFGISNHNKFVSYNKYGEKVHEYWSPINYEVFRVYKQLKDGSDFFSGKSSRTWEPYSCISTSKVNKANNIFYDSTKYSNDVISLNDSSFFTFQEDTNAFSLNYYHRSDSLAWKLNKSQITGIPDSLFDFIWPKFIGTTKNSVLFHLIVLKQANPNNLLIKNEFVKVGKNGSIKKRVLNQHNLFEIHTSKNSLNLLYLQGYDSSYFPLQEAIILDTNFYYFSTVSHPMLPTTWSIDAIMPEKKKTVYVSFRVKDSIITNNNWKTEVVKFEIDYQNKKLTPKKKFSLFFNQQGSIQCDTCFIHPGGFFRSKHDGGFHFQLGSYFTQETAWLGKCDSLGNIDFIDPKSTLQMNPPLFVGEKQPKNNNLVVFPNPTKGLAFVTGLPNAGTISILNAQGKLIYHSKTTGNHCTIETEFLPIGIYFIQFQSDDGCCTRFGKLVVKN